MCAILEMQCVKWKEDTVSTPEEVPQKANTYIFNAESAAEMNRLTIQDRLLTKEMGGLLPDGVDPSSLHKVLDVACGPGGWALDLAYAYRHMEVVGIDLSEKMVQYATSRKWPNATFRVMDVRQPLDFPDDTFDFINARLLFGFMPKASWPNLLKECIRIVRPGGSIRLTESESAISNSPVFEKLQLMMAHSLYLTGQTFSPSGIQIGITPMLSGFLRTAGCEHIRHSSFAVDFSADGDAHGYMYQNFQIGLLISQPFLRKMNDIGEVELAELCNQALKEMESAEFRGIWYHLSTWGRKPV